jgi:hypothetical protein
MKPDFSRLKLYQDGLPVCGKEEAIVKELAGRESRNHALLMQLVERGASLIGTESPGLLMEEYRRLRSSLSRPASAPMDDGGLLERRDRFIARRIHATLGEGEHGLLFIGLLHDVHRCLPETIQVNFLIQRLPFAHDIRRRITPESSGDPPQTNGERRTPQARGRSSRRRD